VSFQNGAFLNNNGRIIAALKKREILKKGFKNYDVIFARTWPLAAHRAGLGDILISGE
jgi:hypothetical protein